MANNPDYLTAQAAAARLGVSTATLYAYVSRGLLRSEHPGGKSRARRYLAADVEALLARKEYRREPSRAAEDALLYGMPVLDSAITLIADGQLYYRGHDVVALATSHTFEAVAALLWTGGLGNGAPAAAPPAPDAAALAPAHALAAAHPIARCQAVLARAATLDLGAHQLTPQGVAATGVRILHLEAGALGGAHPPELPGAAPSLAGVLGAAWCPARPEAADLLSAALILCADHELNVSAFTARCVASAGATPYAVVIAALAALEGTRHGGHTVQVSALLDAAADGVRPAVGAFLRDGGALPGFGHPLYPGGDPRARLLLALLGERCPGASAVTLAADLCAAVHAGLGLYPTIDLALAVLARTLGAPRHAPLALFALGRTAGWLAHAGEQYALGRLIRPRARYTGVIPPT